jgi:hypothetical protein
VSASANITGGNILTGGLISATGNIAGNYFIGNGSALTGITVAPGSQIVNGTSNVTVASGANVTVGVAGTTVATFASTGEYIAGIVSASGNIVSTANVTGGNLLTGGLISSTGTVTGSSVLGSVVSASANITGGNLLTGGLISATSTITSAANITGGNILTGGLVSATGTVTGSSVLGSVVSASANVTGGNILTGGLISATGTVTGSSVLGSVVSVSANITGGNILTGGLISATGNVTASNVIINGTAAAGSAVLIVSGNIQVTGTNAVANIGSVTTYFNTIHGKSTTAQYADLAELYVADSLYLPGTVLDFGGANEVTLSSVASSARVAGVVSTAPAYLMNGMIQADTAVALALMGRAPASVTGIVRKGDMMVSAGNGVAQACATPAMGTVIGKSLEDFDGGAGMIEIVIGRL